MSETTHIKQMVKHKYELAPNETMNTFKIQRASKGYCGSV